MSLSYIDQERTSSLPGWGGAGTWTKGQYYSLLSTLETVLVKTASLIKVSTFLDNLELNMT